MFVNVVRATSTVSEVLFLACNDRFHYFTVERKRFAKHNSSFLVGTSKGNYLYCNLKLLNSAILFVKKFANYLKIAAFYCEIRNLSERSILARGVSVRLTAAVCRL